MTDPPANRLDELTGLLKNNKSRPVPDVVCDFQEAIVLAVSSGRNDLASYLTSTYLDFFEPPVFYEVRFFCEYNTGTRLWRQGNLDEAEAKYRSCRELALSNDDELSAARCLMALGVISWTVGNYSKSLTLLEKAEEGLRERKDLTLSNCLNWLGVICSNLQLLPRAWSYYREALELNEEMGFRINQGYLLCNLGLLCQQMELTDQAEQSYRDSMELQKESGNKYGYADSLANMGMLVLKKRDRPEEALSVLIEAAEMQEENGVSSKAGLVYTNAAVAAFRTGDTDRSMELFDRAEELVFSTDVWNTQVEFCGMKAQVLVTLERLDEAADLLERGCSIQEANLPGKDEHWLLRIQSEVFEKKGDIEKAYRTLLRSTDARERLDDAKSIALQSVIQIVTDSVRKKRELHEIRHEAEILEERNKSLSHSSERFRNLVNGMSGIGVLAVDREGRVTFWNDTCTKFYGYRQKEVQGKKLSDLIVPDHLRNWFSAFLEGGLKGEEFEVNLMATDGVLKNVLVSLVPLSQGETFLIQVDLTSQRRAENQRSLIEAQMRRTQKLEALGTLAGGIAHDFNNLLQGILGNASLLCESIDKKSEQYESAKLIRTAAERSSELCVQMLDYAGVKPVGHEVLNMNDVIRDISVLLETSLPKDVDLVLDLSRDIPMIRGDRSQLRQVVMNLVLNGAEAIAKTGHVVISTDQVHMERDDFIDNLLEESPGEGNYLFLQVKDEGIGIEPGTLARMFDPFYSTKKTGRGLGLAAVLGIIRGHSGAITVRSHPGDGSLFNIYLSASTEDEAASSVESEPEETAELTGRTILIVDDEQIVRETISAIVRSSGNIPVALNGGAEAIEYLEQRSTPPDLMILDLTMPGLSGVDVFKMLGKKGIEIPVIIISGYSRDKLSSLFTCRQPRGFLQKPFTPDELKKQIGMVLGGP